MSDFKIYEDIPFCKGWDKATYDFKQGIVSAINQYRDVLTTAKEISDNNDELVKHNSDLKVQLSQLKHAVKSIHSGLETDCAHINGSYNGEATWCFNCKRIWLIEDLSEKLKKLRKTL